MLHCMDWQALYTFMQIATSQNKRFNLIIGKEKISASQSKRFAK